MFYDVKKIVTDNPFVDHIIYQCKLIIMNCITKDSDKADNMETVESMKNYSIYKSCLHGNANWLMWKYFPDEVIYNALSSKYTTRKIKAEFLREKEFIYSEDRDAVVQAMSEYVIHTYEEKNDYYRELCGYRPFSNTTLIPLSDYDLSYFEGELDIYKYLHELSDEQMAELVKIGIMDKIYKDYPDERWIFFLMMRLDPLRDEIKITIARDADKFDLLYIPEDVDDLMKNEFIEKYELNREYVMTTIYSDAMKIDSDYYDNFIQILIMIMTMVDLLDNAQVHIARRDVFDSRCIEFIFEQYGVPYYNEIPIFYQTAMMRNLNRLLKFKSSARCMIDLCSLFGFPSKSVFQYYMLRKRRVDANGNYIFNYKLKSQPINCTPTTKKINIVSIDEGSDSNYVTINYPVSDYFAKGNKIEVIIDDSILPEEAYTIAGGKIVFDDLSYLEGKNKIEIVYIYNEDQSIMDEVGNHEILMKDEILEFHKQQRQYQLNPPEPDYFNNGGFCFLIIGTLLINQDLYVIDYNTMTLTFTDLAMETLKDDNRYMRILYMYSNSIEVKHKSVDITATEIGQRIFQVPEPFEGYCDAGLKFFVTIGGVYISAERYHLKGNYLHFNNEDDYVDQGRIISFHFIYNDFSPVELIEESIPLEVTESNQLVFDIPVPFPSYFDEGNFIFLRIRGDYIDPNLYYVLNNKLHIKPGYGVFKGTEVVCDFIYGKNEGIRHTQYNIKATINYQQDFLIPWPYKHFLEKKNIMKVFVKGVEYIRDLDFCIKEDMLEIFRVDKSLSEGEEIEFHFFTHVNNENHIAIKETKCNILKQNQNKFVINPPFYNYFQTGNKMFMTMGSVFIAENQYVIEDDKLTFLDDSVLEMTKDRDIYFTFVYHTIYERYNQAVHIEKDTHDLTQQSENPDGSLKITVPFPFENYMELGNTFEMRIEGTKIINSSEYDLIDNQYVLIIDPATSVYPYGTNIQFVFIYTCTGYEDVYEEDLDKDLELKFVKVPLLDNPDKYLKEESNYLEYDHIVRSDASWDGDYTHDHVKNILLDEQISYTRTKYFSLTNLMSMGNITYQLPYFMNMILDDIKVEEKLTLKLPYISSSHEFKLNDVLVYMMALSHRFLGINDEVPTIQKTLYIKGFNFQADLATISDYIQERMKDDGSQIFYKISDKYKSFKMFKGQIPTYRELLEVYTTNTEIYDHVVYEMNNAENKAIYDCYKKIYESLMLVKESKRFFRTDSGEQAKTLTEWIEFRDDELYDSLMYIDSLDEDELKKNQISEYLENCVYQLSAYLKEDQFQAFFSSFAGTNNNTVLNYLLKVLNFFKSYKIQIHNIATEYLFDDRIENTIRLIDEINYSSAFDVNENGHSIFEILNTFVSFTLRGERISDSIRDIVYTAMKSYITRIQKDFPEIIDDMSKISVQQTIPEKIELTEEQIHRITIERHTYFDDTTRDSALLSLYLTPEQRIQIAEKLQLIVERYVNQKHVLYTDIKDDIAKFSDIFFPNDDTRDVPLETLTQITYFSILEQNANFLADKLEYSSNLKWDLYVKFKEKLTVFVKHFSKLVGKTLTLNDIFDKVADFYATFTKTDKYRATDVMMNYMTQTLTDEKFIEDSFKIALDRIFSLFISPKEIMAIHNHMDHEETYRPNFIPVVDSTYNINLYYPYIYEMIGWIHTRFNFIEQVQIHDEARLSKSHYNIIKEYDILLDILNSFISSYNEITDYIASLDTTITLKSTLSYNEDTFCTFNIYKTISDDTQVSDKTRILTLLHFKETSTFHELHTIYKEFFKTLSIIDKDFEKPYSTMLWYSQLLSNDAYSIQDTVSLTSN